MREALVNGHSLMLPDWRADFYDARQDQGWERERMVSCADIMQPGMRVYDIGAEHGDFTALYKKWVGPSGDVIPVEPSPHYWPIIKEIWDANGFASPPSYSFCGFVSDETEYSDELMFGWVDEVAGEGIPDGGFRHLVDQRDATAQITLEELAYQANIPDAIVMDIEGAEWHALSAGQDLLSAFHPICWISIHPPILAEWYHKTPDDIHNLFKDCGYEEGELLGAEQEEWWIFQ